MERALQLSRVITSEEEAEQKAILDNEEKYVLKEET